GSCRTGIISARIIGTGTSMLWSESRCSIRTIELEDTIMDFKLFMNSVEETLSLIKTEEDLRNWVRNYARSIPEEDRGNFLEQMQTRKSCSHKEILQELTDW